MKTSKHRVLALVATAGLLAAGCSIIGGYNGPAITPIVTTTKQPVGWIYTTLYNQDAVMEIDKVQSRASKDPILVGAGPRALAIDPRGRGEYLYVVCERGNAVAIVDRRNRLVNRTINVGSSPFAIAITPKGERAFVTNAGDDTVSIIDLKTQTVIQTVQLNTAQTNQPGATPTKLKPQGVAVNATGTRAFVACGSGQVVVLEGTVTSQYSASRNIVLAGSVSPTNIAVNSSGSDDFVYITDPAANRLFSFNGAQSAQQAEVREISGGPWGVAVGNNPQTGRADRLYVTTYQGNALYPLTLPDLQAATSGGQGLSVEGKEPRGVAVSPIGDEVYVSLAGQNTVAIFTRAGSELSRPEVFQTSTLNTQYLAPTGDLALGGFLNR